MLPPLRSRPPAETAEFSRTDFLLVASDQQRRDVANLSKRIRAGWRLQRQLPIYLKLSFSYTNICVCMHISIRLTPRRVRSLSSMSYILCNIFLPLRGHRSIIRYRSRSRIYINILCFNIHFVTNSYNSYRIHIAHLVADTVISPLFLFRLLRLLDNGSPSYTVFARL